MAQRVIWSDVAIIDRREIFEYWNNRNRSKNYSRKLNKLFQENIELIANHPTLGRPTRLLNVRSLIVRDYAVVYDLSSEQDIKILRIWDTRQNPDKLFKRIDI